MLVTKKYNRALFMSVHSALTNTIFNFKNALVKVEINTRPIFMHTVGYAKKIKL